MAVFVFTGWDYLIRLQESKYYLAYDLIFCSSSRFQIAAEVAAPLAKTDEIVLLGGADRTTTEVNKLISQLPPAVSALTGVDLTGVWIHWTMEN